PAPLSLDRAGSRVVLSDRHLYLSSCFLSMHYISEFFHHLHSLRDLISWGGLVVLIGIIFAETGLLVGFFLPGDSLLVTAGLFAATGDLPLVWLLLSLTAAAVAGNSVGYWIREKAA